MNRETTAWTRVSGGAARVTSDWSRRTARLIVGVLGTAFLSVITLAPAGVTFALTVGVAAAWCAWLETARIHHCMPICQLETRSRP